MGLNLSCEYGQTPLEYEELEGLKLFSISTKKDLDEHEQLNIENAMMWIAGKNWKKDKILTEYFVKNLHKKMYGDVWKWAGKFRMTEKNIGVSYYKIPMDLKQLLEDTKFWMENSSFSPEEIAIRFKHRLVAIHCFPNGNGRHSRLMADIILEKIYTKNVFSWGISKQNLSALEVRKQYIDAVKSGDLGDILPLINFALS